MKNVALLVEQLVLAITWALLHKAIFSKSRPQTPVIRALFVLVIGGTAYFVGNTSLDIMIPFLNVIAGSLFNGFKAGRRWKEVVVENISSYMITRIVWLGTTALSLLIFSVLPLHRDIWIECLCNCTMQVLACVLLCKYVDLCKWEIFLSKYSFLMITIAGTMFAVSLSVIIMPYVQQKRDAFILASVVVIGSMAILVTWVRSEYRWQREKEDLSKRAEELVRRAHKYKSVVPTVERELRMMQKMLLREHRWEAAAEVGCAIDEVSNLGKEMSADSMREMLEEPCFSSTGLLLLDGQLQRAREDAAEQGIVLDCTVTAPIDALVKQGVLGQFQLQQMVGDLVDNAFRAVSLQEGKDKRILLILGETQEGYQIKICDTGLPFPAEILRRFGERGLTTGGTGHGLADLCGIMAACGGSIRVEEYGEGAFTKAISLTMDGRATLAVHSAPAGLDYERSLAQALAGEGV